jgi:hypothetical protein
MTLLFVLGSTACALDTEGRANVIPHLDGGFGSTSGDGGDTDAWGLSAQSIEAPAAEAMGGAGGVDDPGAAGAPY